ncbi:MAG: SsrA-binding protein SmpB [Calditrichaceae bacterium]|nr:SsrA-binding protein SmpB [Calditrichia bacterium]NUQ43884.1 SsrA-binding protein SmpB [Calditrichaceae bacterium]
MSENIKIITSNKKAFHDYHISETVEAGMVLTGTEVKSLRAGRCNLKDSYAKVINDELWLIGMHISAYENEGYVTHDPEARRKLLLHRSEIRRLHRKVLEKGITLIPLKLYFKNGWAKVELGLASGKRQYDKRQDIAQRDQQREMKRLQKKYKVK